MIIDAGYEADLFGDFLEKQKQGGNDLENWDLEDLKEIVDEFTNNYGPRTIGEQIGGEKDYTDRGSILSFEESTGRASTSRLSEHPFERMLELLSETVVKCKAMYISITRPSTILSDEENVSVKITRAEKIKPSGVFSSNYVVYHIKTEPFNIEVKRRYKQFEWLHQCLKNRFPANYVNTDHSDSGSSAQGAAVYFR